MNAHVAQLVPVTTVPIAFQPDRGRTQVTLPAGMTIAQIVAIALPGATEAVLARTQVSLVLGDGVQIVPRVLWRRARPNPGVHVVIRIIPGKDALRSVLMLLVSVAAIAITNFFFPVAGAFAQTTLGQGIRGLLTGALTGLGGLLINALLPPDKPEKAEKPVFAIAGLRNQFTPDAPVPVNFGTNRVAPPFAAQSYIEVVGDVLYNRAVFLWGYGPVEISDLKLGDTLLSKFDEVEIETRLGYDDDAPLTLYTQQTLSEDIGADMVREFPRADDGEIQWNEPTEEKPVSRFTARDATHCINIFSMPAGLVKVKANSKKEDRTIQFRVRIRLVDEDDWAVLPDFIIRAKKQAGFFRAHRIDFPVRGAYEVEYTRLTASEVNDDNAQYILNCTWVVLQSWRPEYPFNFRKAVAMSALRIKATSQLNGTLDTFNGILKRIARDWDAETSTWTWRATKNPAAAALFALQGPALYKRIPDEQIDFSSFEGFADFCEEKGLAYNRYHDFDGTLGETLAAIGAAGRAAVRWNGRQWYVVIDRPRDLVVDHVNARNASDFRWTPSYFTPPHGLRVSFLDETNDYSQAERIIRWPGHVGPIDVTLEIKLPGKTHPDEIFAEALRRAYEMLYRAVHYTAVQQGTARTATVGDKVVASLDVLKRYIHSARVKAVRGDLVEIDDVFEMDADESYVIRFRAFDPEDADDTIGTSVVRTIATKAGENSALRLTGGADDGMAAIRPQAGDIVQFGPAAKDSIPLIIAGIERGKNMSSVLHMLPSAEIIDELVDAAEIPAWSGRVGEIVPSTVTATDDDEINLSDDDGVRLIDDALPAPAAPYFVGISTGDDDSPTNVGALLGPGPGPDAIVAYAVDHQLTGAPGWSTATSAAGAGVVIGGYAFGNDISLRARAQAANGEWSVNSAVVTFKVGTDTEFLAEIDTFNATRLVGGLWRYEWTPAALAGWQTPVTIAGAKLRYRVGAWSAWDDLLPVHTGLVTTSPWDASTPIEDGVYTFGIVLVGEDGEESAPRLIFGIAPASAIALADDDLSLIADDDDIPITEDT